MTGAIYRAVKTNPASPEDFLSHREKELPCTFNDCNCWGISVWTDIEQVVPKILFASFEHYQSYKSTLRQMMA